MLPGGAGVGNKIWLKSGILMFLDTSIFGNPFWFDLKGKHIVVRFHAKLCFRKLGCMNKQSFVLKCRHFKTD